MHAVESYTCGCRCGEVEQNTEQYLPELSALKHAEAPSYYGVVWREFNSKWEAHVNMDNKQRFLGYYATEEDAHMHGAAALRLQSQQAKPSFAPACQVCFFTPIPDGLGLGSEKELVFPFSCILSCVQPT